MQIQIEPSTAPMPHKQLHPAASHLPSIVGNRGGRRGAAAAAAAARERDAAATSTNWGSGFFDCCCSVSPTYCCMVTCCPCTTIASVKENMGGNYEAALLYFGGLAFGVWLCLGLAASNTSNGPSTNIDEDLTIPPEPSSDTSDHHRVTSHLTRWGLAAFFLLLAFLLGVWRLRSQTRRSLGIHGSAINDCVSSVFCCYCVVSQLHLELKCHHEDSPATRYAQYQRQRGDNDRDTNAETRRVDTLAPYAAM